MRARLKPGTRAEYERMFREMVQPHTERGLVAVQLAFEDKDPDRVIAVIHFKDRESYVRNADDPRTDADYRRQAEFFEGPPEWTDVQYGPSVGNPTAQAAGAAS